VPKYSSITLLVWRLATRGMSPSGRDKRQ